MPARLKPPKLLSERHFIPHYPAKAPLQQVKLGTFNEMREHERGLDVILARLESKKTQLTPNSPTLLDRVPPNCLNALMTIRSADPGRESRNKSSRNTEIACLKIAILFLIYAVNMSFML